VFEEVGAKRRQEQLEGDEVQRKIFKELQRTTRQNWAIIVIALATFAVSLGVALHVVQKKDKEELRRFDPRRSAT
jgi:L-cystine uptake protein TcyP (sodium:dicarboxylate symporter family)